jgi:uncharacterized protein YbaP (TraB family)
LKKIYREKLCLAKRVLPLFYLLIIFSLALSCASARLQTESNKNNLFLWKLEQGNAVLFLYGSIHMGTDTIYPLDERIYQAYAEADKLIVELNTLNQGKSDKIRGLP